MTKNQTLQKVTDEYLSSLVISSTSDIDAIEENLLAKVHEAFDEHNVICDKDKKWKMPDSLNFSQIADIMASVFSIKRICCCPNNSDTEYDLLGIYVDENLAHYIGNDAMIGIYVTSEDVFNKLAAKFNYTMTSKDFDEIMKALRRKVPRVRRCNDKDLIAVGNGIFNYATKTLEEFDENKVFLTKSPVFYNPNAINITIHNPQDNTDWDAESWMKSLSDDDEVVNLLWEIIGAIIRPNVRWNKSAWLYSETGNNGKGTLCELMRSICGDTCYASIPLADFGKDFALEPLTRASAIIVDENDVGTFIDKAGNLKSVITNDVIPINRKFKTPISFQFYGFMVQCLNEFPKIKDKSDSFYRRQLFIPMTKCFTGAERKYIKNEYLHRQDVLEYILKRVLEMNYYSLSEPRSCMKALTEYKEFNDPVRQFWDELRTEFVWDMLPFTFLYDLYKSWFKLNSPSGTVLGKTTFVNDLLQIIKNDKMWYCVSKDYQVKTSSTNIGDPEPLILDYNLVDWKSKSYRGNNPTRICEFDSPKVNYRGILRATPATNTDEEENA